MNKITKNSITPFEDVCGLIYELYQSDNMSVTIATIKGKSKPHKHEIMEEVYYVLKGEGTLVIGNKEIDIQPGDLIPIPKGEFHHVEVAPSTGSGEEMEVLVVTHPRFLKDDVIEQE